MSRRPPAAMSDEDILAEIELNAKELLALVRSSPQLSGWDKGVVVAGTVVTIGGLILTGPVTIVGLLIAGAGLTVIGVDLAKKTGDLRGAQEIVKRTDYLRVRNAALKNMLHRRHPGIAPP